MLSRIARFSDDASGLEKILRFGQYASLTVSALPIPAPDTKVLWKQVQGQFALSRRFFRIFKWYGCWMAAYQAFESDDAPAEKLLRTAKWSFLGLYLFFEMYTITNAMNITVYAWAQFMQREALKFWLYAIISSIVLSSYQLWAGVPKLRKASRRKTKTNGEASESKKNGVPVQNAVEAAYPRIYVQLVIDCADVLIPGASLGWLPLDALYVGIAGSLSSILAGQDVWNRVQAQPYVP